MLGVASPFLPIDDGCISTSLQSLRMSPAWPRLPSQSTGVHVFILASLNRGNSKENDQIAQRFGLSSAPALAKDQGDCADGDRSLPHLLPSNFSLQR